MNEKIITFPWIGKQYTKILKNSLENLGLNIQLPPKTSGKTIKLGVKNSSDMICFPYKATLGNFIEAIEQGANILLMYDSLGQCRLRHYNKIQEFTLKSLDYDFEMYGINKKNLFNTLKKLSGKSTLKIFFELKNLLKNIKKYDKQKTIWLKDKPNIGIIGEIFCCCDETINYNIEEKIKSYGANPYNTVTLSSFLNQNLFSFFKKQNYYEKKAKKYFNGSLGGHGIENIHSLFELVDKKVDGVIHILPLSCMPETTVEPFINRICSDSNIPLLRIPIDENNSEANLETRLETFVELIKWKRK